MKKRSVILITCLSLVLVFTAIKPNAQSRTKVYYSGEAISYNNQVVFATVNTGALELFVLENKEIVRTAKFKPTFVSLPKGAENFHDLSFDVVSGSLYLYLTDGRYLYKYDVSNPYSPRQVEKLKDNAWDWFMQIEKTDDYLVTIGTKEIKYWNQNLEVVNSYKIDYKKAENVSFSRDGKYIFYINDNILEVYSADKRAVETSIWLKVKDNNNRGVYFDHTKSEIFVTDDEALKVFSLSGLELRRFKHTSDYGFDVAPSAISNSIYFSDGIGLVRNDRNSLAAIDWLYTTNIGSGNGWAMDIAVVADNLGDKIVVFNNSEILVLDKEMELVDYFQSVDIDEGPIEALNIKLNTYQGLPGDYVVVSGGGFAAYEEIVVKMKDQKWITSTDSNGRFTRTITVVEMNPQITDIKVDGLMSGLTYSTTFKVY